VTARALTSTPRGKRRSLRRRSRAAGEGARERRHSPRRRPRSV